MFRKLLYKIHHSQLLRRFINQQATNGVDFLNSQLTKTLDSTTLGQSAAQNSAHDELADAVTPLWRIPYHQQLEIKDQKNFEIVQRLTKRLKPTSRPNSIICQLKKTLPSPVTLHYRNKNEFHVKYDSSGRVIVGMCVGKASENTLRCISAEKLLNTHPSHAAIAKHFQDYVEQHSKWKVCEHFQRGGNWRQLTIRSNHKNELMVIATIHPQDLTQEEIRAEMEQMKDYLVSCPINNMISLYYQSCPHTRCTAEQSPFVLLHGQSHIYECIDDYEFRVSPESFFQVNTQGAKVLYETVAGQLKAERLSTVVDLCCGTGTQGLMVARQCRGVIGIELSRSAVEDARFNAVHNQIHNAEFFAGRVENIFQSILDQLTAAPDIAVIINPSRGGVGSRVIKMLRDNDRVRHLVYVSCQADGPAMNNFVALCERPHRKLKSEPFELRRAIPVDMFPHTNHCELVLSFRR